MWSFGLLLIALTGVFGASLPPCPDSCKCVLVNEKTHAQCASLDVIRKLQPKQIRYLEELTVNNASLTDFDPKLKVLRNLVSLDLYNNSITSLKSFPFLPNLQNLNLSANKIKYLNPSDLPTTLNKVNVSQNFISDIPDNWGYLPNLREIDLSGNPITCSCSSTSTKNYFDKMNIIAQPIYCKEPKEFRGKTWDDPEICPAKNNVWDFMQGDGPMDDGSGSGYIETDTVTDNGAVLVDDNIESEFIPDLGHSNVINSEEEEGSGDFMDERPKACHINCSTPPPIGEEHENASVVAPLDAIRILAEDVIMVKPQEETTTVVTVIVVSDYTPALAEEKTEAAEVFTRVYSSPSGDLKEEISEPKESNSTYILLAILCALVLMLVLYALMKNKKSRENRRRRVIYDDIEKKPQIMTEMKPLNKSPPEEPSNIPEKVPLMNGQNGTPKPEEKDKPDDHDYVELRKKQDTDNLLTPEAKRVTIKAGEIPESIPRTPILVNRHVSSDGNIITTPSPERLS